MGLTAWTGVPDGLGEGFRYGGDRNAVMSLQLRRIACGDTRYAQLGHKQETVGRPGGDEVLLPCRPKVRQCWSEGHIVAEDPFACGSRSLKYGLLRVHERPIVRQPVLGKPPEGDTDVEAPAGKVGIGEHHVVERAEKRELVAVYLLVEPEDRAYSLSRGVHGGILAELGSSHAQERRARASVFRAFAAHRAVGLQYGCSKKARCTSRAHLVYCGLQELQKLPEKDSNLH